MTAGAGPIMLVAVSARMLAQLAVRDGFDVVAYDRFGDADLRALCDGGAIHHDLGGVGRMADLVALAADDPAGAVVYGAGLEDRPDLVAALGRDRCLLGTPAEALPGVRDPWQLGEAVEAAGAAFPHTLACPPPPAGVAPHGWLRKPRQGGGGRGVRRWRGGRLRPTELLQAYQVGVPCSAVAVAGGGRAAVLGLTEQLVGDRRLGARGFTWCGNVTPPRLPTDERAGLHAALEAVAMAVAARHDLRGVFGIDAIWDGERAWVHELNPRPPAGLEVVDRVRGGGGFALHVAACRGGRLDDGRKPGAGAAAKLVVYARRPVVAPPLAWWPAGARDVPQAEERIRAHHPICTLVADGDDPGTLVDRLLADAASLHAALPTAEVITHA